MKRLIGALALAFIAVLVLAPTASAQSDANSDGCDDGYQGACVPYRTDRSVNCSDIPTQVIIVGDDPYSLDQGGQVGLGCEGNTALPTSGAPAPSAPSDTAPPATVAAATATAPGQLATTGANDGLIAIVGGAVLAAGFLVLTLSAGFHDPLGGHVRGATTVTATDRRGRPFTYTVASRRR